MNGPSDCIAYMGTEDGVLVYLLDGNYSMKMVGRGLEGNAVRAIAVHPEKPNTAWIGCGLRGWGLYRTDNYGESFRSLGFEDRWIWDVAYQPDNLKVLWIGTEPPMIYKMTNEGSDITALKEIELVRSRKQWKFFHPPFYGGHIHGITFHPDHPRQVFACVEQGALLHSRDGGENWEDALHGYDLHRIACDPYSPRRVLAGAGEGLLISHDSGLSWEMNPEMKRKYVHGIAFDPFCQNRVFVYADDASSPLYRSDDGGTTWRPIGGGLPAAKPSDNLALHPAVPNVLFYAGDVSSRESVVYCSRDAGESWVQIPGTMPKVWRVKVV